MAESELRLEAFRQIFESIPDAAAIRSLRTGLLVAVNRELERMTGYPRAELVGRSPRDLGLWTNEALYQDGLSAVTNREVLRNVEAEFRTKEGKRIIGLVSASRVDLADESYIVTYVRDITALRESERRARLRADLSTMLSHDIRTPLMAILNSLYVLRLPTASKEDRTAAYERIERSTRTAIGLAQNFVDVGRIESGLLQPDVSPVSLNELVIRAAREQEGMARARRIAVQLSLDPDLPAIPLDGRLIERALANLLANALKFSPSDEAVVVRTAKDGDRVVLEVQDRGPGVRPEDRPQLFKRYARSGRPGSDGTGLGLFVVRTFVEAHRGSVDAVFPSNGGSIFKMSFVAE